MKPTSLFVVLVAGCGAFSGHAHAKTLAEQFPVKGAASNRKPRGPLQEKLAAKGAFPVVKASALKGSLPAANLAGAKKLVGQVATFVGTVTDVYAPKSNSIVLLNFAKDYKTALVGAVKSSDFSKFPPLKSLKGKKVALHGSIISFKGAPEIELKSAGAIRIVK